MAHEPRYPNRMDSDNQGDHGFPCCCCDCCDCFKIDDIGPKIRVLGIILLILAYIALLFFNGSVGTGDLGIFQHTPGNLSATYDVPVAPQDWVYYIWIVIFIWLGLAIGYEFALLFRKDSLLNRLYRSSPVAHPLFNLLLIADFGMVVGWMFVYDGKDLSTSAGLIVIIALMSMLTVGVGSVSVEKKKYDISSKDVWMTRLCVLNGVAVFSTWILLSALQNCCTALHVIGGTKNETVALFFLYFLGVATMGYFLLEISVLEKYLRYIGTPYIVLLWTLGAIFMALREKDDMQLPSDICLALIILVGTLFIVRVILSIVRHTKDKHHDVNT